MSSEKIDASGMIVDNHFPMVNSRCGPPYINAVSSMLLGLGAKTLSCKKGIKLRPGETFRYKKEHEAELNINNKRTLEKKHSLYIYEAGVHPEHAKTLNSDIMIYVTRDGGAAVLVGTLSAAHPCVRLELTFGEDCELSHSSAHKTLFFNGFDFSFLKSPKLLPGKGKVLPDRTVWSNTKSVTLEVDKEIWVAEVCPSKELNFNPVDEEKEYHLLEVFSRKNTNVNINLYGHKQEPKRKSLGKIVAGCNRTRLNTVFHDKFTLSHTSNTTSVFFSGYTVPANQQFKLEELDPNEYSLKSSRKISLKPEYKCYKAILAKVPTGTPKQQPTGTPKQQPTGTPKQQPTGTPKQQPTGIFKQQVVNHVTMSPLTAPLIFDHRASYQLISANPCGLFWVPKQE